MGYPFKVNTEEENNVTAGSLWTGFEDSTTVHGVPHVAKAVGKSKTFVWFLISLTALGMLTYHMFTICSIYFSYGVSVKITILQEYAIDFPAVTFCNLNPIKKSNIGLDIVIESLLGDVTPNKSTEKRRKKRYTDTSPTCASTDRLQEELGLCYRLLTDRLRKLTGRGQAKDKCKRIDGAVYFPCSQSRVDFMKETDLFNISGVTTYWNWIMNDAWAGEYSLSTSGFTYWGNKDLNLESAISEVSNNHLWTSKKRDDNGDMHYTLCQDMVQCPHPVYDPDGDGLGFCWMRPFGDAVNSWDTSEIICRAYDPDAYLIELDSLEKMNHFITKSGILDGTLENRYWLNINGESWIRNNIDVSWNNLASNPSVYGHSSSDSVLAYIDQNHTWFYAADNDASVSSGMVVCEIANMPYVLPQIIPTIEPTTTIEPATIIEPKTTTTIAEMTTTIEPTTSTEQMTTVEPTSTVVHTTPFQLTVPTQQTTITASTTITSSSTPKATTVPVSSVEGKLPLKEEFILQETVIENLAVIPDSVKTLMGYKAYEFVVDCTYEGSTCTKEDFYQYYSPIMGNCYIFNSGWNNTAPVKSAKKAGRRYGLSVILNIGEEEYVEKLGGSSGARVVTTGQNEMPHPEQNGIFVEPGKLASIGVKKVVIERLGNLYGNCTDELKNQENDVYSEFYPVKYSRNNCKKTCYQQKVIETCGCGDSHYPMSGAAFGGRSVLPCDVRNIAQDDCKYRVNTEFVRGKLGCSEKCLDVCSEEYFTYHLSDAHWPSKAHKNKIVQQLRPKIHGYNLSESGMMERNLLTVEVFYDDSSYKEMREIPAYPAGQFASDIGGILGLWIGMSVITVFEFIELFIDSMVFIMIKLCKRNKAISKYPEDNKSSVVLPVESKVGEMSHHSRIMRIGLSSEISETLSESLTPVESKSRTTRRISVNKHDLKGRSHTKHTGNARIYSSTDSPDTDDGRDVNLKRLSITSVSAINIIESNNNNKYTTEISNSVNVHNMKRPPHWWYALKD